MQHLWLCKQYMLEQLLLHAFDSNGVYRSLSLYNQTSWKNHYNSYKKEKKRRRGHLLEGTKWEIPD